MIGPGLKQHGVLAQPLHLCPVCSLAGKLLTAEPNIDASIARLVVLGYGPGLVITVQPDM